MDLWYQGVEQTTRAVVINRLFCFHSLFYFGGLGGQGEGGGGGDYVMGSL